MLPTITLSDGEMAGVELLGILVSFGSLDSSLVDATDCTDPG